MNSNLDCKVTESNEISWNWESIEYNNSNKKLKIKPKIDFQRPDYSSFTVYCSGVKTVVGNSLNNGLSEKLSISLYSPNG